MKSILLTSTALIAFAGAAMAESHESATGVSFGGDAKLGYNDDFKNGVFWEVGLTMKASAALNNGMTVGATLDIDIAPNGADDGDANVGTFEGFDIRASDYVLSLTSDTASLYFGDVNTGAKEQWAAVGNMDGDSFADNDDFSDNGYDAVLRGDVNVAGFNASVSYGVNTANAAPNNDLAGLSVGASGSFGAFGVSAAYQDSDAPNGEIMAISGNATVAGANVALGYAKETIDNVQSIGVSASYPVGPVTVSAFYVAQSADVAIDDNYGVGVAYENGPLSVEAHYHAGQDEETAIEASYAAMDGLDVYAGYIDEGQNGAGLQQGKISYIGADYDLGSNATLRASYADVNAGVGGVDSDLDDLGAKGLYQGTTVQVSFKF